MATQTDPTAPNLKKKEEKKKQKDDILEHSKDLQVVKFRENNNKNQTINLAKLNFTKILSCHAI